MSSIKSGQPKAMYKIEPLGSARELDLTIFALTVTHLIPKGDHEKAQLLTRICAADVRFRTYNRHTDALYGTLSAVVVTYGGGWRRKMQFPAPWMRSFPMSDGRVKSKW